ncbi:putative ribonuclease H-like domain-containing protein [Tanacetum coccineum]
MDLETARTTTTKKLPILKHGEYNMWRLKIKQYFQVLDYALWDVIENGNSFKLTAQTTTNADGTSTTLIPGPVTTEEKVQKKNDVKARSMFLMALPNEHLMTFNQYKDAKTLFAAIQTRFGEDLNLKFLRSLHSEWNTHVVVRKNKPDLDTMSFDDLYNNFKIVKQEVKRTASSSSSSSSQNMAFVSSPSSTNEDNTAYGVSTANTQKTGRKITINGSDAAGYDKSKVECFNCHKMGHFVREYRGPRNQDNRNRNQDSSRRTINVEETSSKAMVAINGVGFDWSYMADDKVPTNMALMAFSDSKLHIKEGKSICKEQLVFYFTKKIRVISTPNLDLSCSGLEEFQQPEFECYGPKTSKSVSEDISNEVKEFPDAPLVEELVSDDKLEKKTADCHIHKKKSRLFNCGSSSTYREQGPICNDFPRILMEDMLTNWRRSQMRTQYYCKGTHKTQNGVTERRNRTLIEAARTMLADSKLPTTFWAEAVNTACYVQNKNVSNDEPQPPSNAGKKDDEGVCKESGIEDQERPKNNNVTLEATHADFFADEAEVNMSNITTIYLVLSTLNTRIHKDHSLDNVIGDVQSEPKRITKALSDSAWVKAMQEELLQFMLQKGHTQEEGIDYDDVFAPVARIEAIRLFLAYASFMGFMVYQMDVKSAFLYGRIEEEVYVCQPPGFEDPDYPDKVYKVVKALYGLHQAPRAWYETLAKYLLDNGFHRGKIDQTLFIKKQKGDILLVQVYVDDIIFGSTKKELCTEFEKLMHDKFQMSSMGELTFFLGLQVKQKEDGIFISQDKYVADILRKFSFTDVRTASTPMDTEKPLLKDSDVCACDKFQVTLKVSHLHAVKRIFRYLKGQPKLGLWYPRDSSFDLVAYSDNEYAGASLDVKSTIGGCQFLGCKLISWQCKKQIVVATSSTKAEYMAAAS